ncbi:MAG: penicillin acylase family protein [Myxococcota bacterium]
MLKPNVSHLHRAAAPLMWATLLLSVSACAPLLRSTYPPEKPQTQIASLKALVEIVLDGLGVPHILAQNDDDAATAIGFMHVRDRQFQLELLRLASQGRLTELLGKGMLDTDRRLRLLSYRVDQVMAQALPAEKARIEAYCRGINEGQKSWPLPLELKLLGHKPVPWTPRDVVLIARFQAWDLSEDARLEALRDKLAAVASAETLPWMLTGSLHFGTPILESEQTRRYRPSLPTVPAPGPGTVLEDTSGKSMNQRSSSARAVDYPAVLEFSPDAREALQAALIPGVEKWLNGELGGSNGWAISGKHTMSGKPILAGDPHLDLPWPPIFYEVHVQTPEIEVSGSTFPGLPMVVIGRAAGVAWTLTTSFADAQDLFTLQPNPSNPAEYLVDGQKEAFESWPQTFKWGDKTDEKLTEDFLATRFGPVYNRGREASVRSDRLYALSWSGFTTEPLVMTGAFDQLYRATSAAAVRTAVTSLPYPSQNWIFATQDGSIGYVLGGKLPARRASPLPRDGSTAASAWTEWLSEAERPILTDPPSGYLVASNQPVLADTGRYNTYASGGYRALRIATALESRSAWTPETVRGLQSDIVNLEASRIVPLLKPALESHFPQKLSDTQLKRVAWMASLLEKWDFAMRAEAPEALLYESWRQHIHRQLFGRHLKDPVLLETYLKDRLSEAPVEVALFSASGEKWWNDPATSKTEVRDEVLVQALIDAEGELSAKLGQDVQSWSWGRLHTLTPEHPFASKKALAPIFGFKPLPAPGGRHTVIALGHEGVVGKYEVASGSAMRQVVQFEGERGYVLAGGNAGQPKHPHAADQLLPWLANRQHAVGGDVSNYRANASQILKLVP